MNSRQLKRIILEEIRNVLKEVNQSIPPPPQDRDLPAIGSTSEEYESNKLIESVVRWVNQLSPLKYREWLQSANKYAPRMYGSILVATQNAMKTDGRVSIKEANFFAEIEDGIYGRNLQNSLQTSGYVNLLNKDKNEH